MCDMKCPFCQQELSETTCSNCDITGKSKLWQELIRTRKELDVAVDALKAITASALQVDYGMRGYTACKIIAESALTALEQKESAFVHNKIEFPEYNDGLLEEFDKQFFENGQDDDLTETALEQKDVK